MRETKVGSRKMRVCTFCGWLCKEEEAMDAHLNQGWVAGVCPNGDMYIRPRGKCLIAGEDGKGVQVVPGEVVGRISQPVEREGTWMALNDWLGTFKPESVDSGFDVLKGLYKCVVKSLTVNEPNQYEANKHYKLQLEVVEVLDGNGSPGRTFRKNYDSTVDKEVQKMLNQLFTAGITLDTSSVEAMEASFEGVAGKTMYVSARGFKPADSNETMQVWDPKAAKSVEKLVAKKSEAPF